MLKSHTATMLLAVAGVAIVASTVCGCGRKQMTLRQAETVAYRWLSDLQKMLSPRSTAHTKKTGAIAKTDKPKETKAPFKPVRKPATEKPDKSTPAKIDQEAAERITAIDGIVLVTAPPPLRADGGSADKQAAAAGGSAHAAADKDGAHEDTSSHAAQTTATDEAKTAEKIAVDELAQFASGPGPQTLRDCFVDDDWDPTGFKNPTEAIAWLTEKTRPLTKVMSIELVEGSAEVTFEMLDKEPVTVVARVKLVEDSPRCISLKVGA